MSGVGRQLFELVEEEGCVHSLTAGFDWDRFQWTLEGSRKTNAVKAIVEARTIGMER